MTVKLPDTSEFQSPANGNAPNWAGIKAQNGGAGIIRVGYGTGRLDNQFVTNYTQMKQLKYSFIGLYLYLRSGQDAVSQAWQFCQWIGPPEAVAPGTVFILDHEEGSGDQSGRADAWLNFVDHFYGLDKLPLNERSWLYSYPDFVNTCNLRGIFSSNRHTWIAGYSSVEPSFGHTLWQSTDGILGSNIVNYSGCGTVDSSVYHGDLATLASMGWKQQVQPPVPPKPPVPDPPKAGEQDMIIVRVTAPNGHSWSGTKTFLYAPGTPLVHIVSGQDQAAFDVALPTVEITWNQYLGLGGT
jgi:hypothetical protein